ncbi:hypothetical protein V5O48_013141 [Marasmius crinis-equi]|uniref:DRBM domain-containing protein n=1 Tax=Marasmius crinis-equi TaxID=585013 RepID=A0ABR3F1B8_9AGAR
MLNDYAQGVGLTTRYVDSSTSLDYVEEGHPDSSRRNGSVQDLEGLPTHSHVAEEAHAVTPHQLARAASPATDSSNDPESDSSDFEASKDLDSSTRGDSIPGPVGSSTQSQVAEEVHTGPPLVASTTSPHAGEEVDESMSQASNNIPAPEVAVDQFINDGVQSSTETIRYRDALNNYAQGAGLTVQYVDSERGSPMAGHWSSTVYLSGTAYGNGLGDANHVAREQAALAALTHLNQQQ